MHARHLDRIAWSLTVAVVGFWVWFGAASAAGERLGWGNVIAHLLMPGGLFAAIAAIAWRWRTVGAILMIAAGATIIVGYPILAARILPLSTIVVALSTLAAPPIAAGVLLLEARNLTRRDG